MTSQVLSAVRHGISYDDSLHPLSKNSAHKDFIKLLIQSWFM